MLIHKCDRCGTVYVSYHTDGRLRKPNAFQFITRYDSSCGGYTEGKSYELCPGCLTYLQDWVNMGLPEIITEGQNNAE